MNRLQKKCLIVSALVHLLLLAILVFGPAFVPTRPPRAEVFEVIEFTPLRTTDLPVTGGGSPTGVRLPPAPKPQPVVQPEPAQTKPEVKPAAAPAVQPARVEQSIREREPPQPEPAPVQPARTTESGVVEAKPKRRLPEVSTQLVSRAQVVGSGTQQRAVREGVQVGPEQFAAAASNLRQRLSGSSGSSGSGSSGGGTTVELLGPGGGGVPYANFKQAVFSAYYNAWTPPAAIPNENVVTKATVTIARDGTVISARITEPSGDPAMDASVQRALDRVKYAAPLPEGTSEMQRTLTIIFDLRAKRGLG